MNAVARDAIASDQRLKITEVFYSLQGEADTVGWPTVFVRLTGCPLRCRWCDTAYAFGGGAWREIDALVAQVQTFGVRHVCVTGGEPLAQPNVLVLLSRLCDAGLHVSLETSGALDCRLVDSRVQRVIDVKTPGSGEVGRNEWANLQNLRPNDCIKFVIADRADFDWSCQVVERYALNLQAQVLFSPVADELAPRDLADWILQSRLPVRLQLQLHKILWGNEAGR